MTPLARCATFRRQRQISSSTFQVGSESVQSSSVVRDLGLYVDNKLSIKETLLTLSAHVSAFCVAVKYIRHSLPPPNCSASPSPRCWSTTVLSRSPVCHRPVSHMSSTPLLVSCVMDRNTITLREFILLLWDQLHWSKVHEQVDYKLCLLTYKSLVNCLLEILTTPFILLSPMDVFSSASVIFKVLWCVRSMDQYWSQWLGPQCCQTICLQLLAIRHSYCFVLCNIHWNSSTCMHLFRRSFDIAQLAKHDFSLALYSAPEMTLKSLDDVLWKLTNLHYILAPHLNLESRSLFNAE